MLAFARSRGGGPTDDFLIVLNSSFLWRAPLLFLLYLEAAAAALTAALAASTRARECARASYCHPAGTASHRRVSPPFSPWPCSGPRDHMSQASSVVDLAWFSGIQRLLQRDDGVHSAHHCALSAAARGQGRQRNLEFPEAVISVNWKKNHGFLHTIRKVKFLSKKSILTKLYNFLGKSKLSTTKKGKSPTFSRVFLPKFF